MALKLPTYVLITPARNEAAFIEQTVRSVLAQTIRPLRWVIVSDGSTDGTDEMVRKYAAAHDWIELLRMPERRERSFAGKATAFAAGFSRVVHLNFEIIGNLDADITFDKDYLPFLLEKFAANPRLGVAGTPFVENNETYDFRFASLEHVSGACQLFRRECFDQIGGYLPLKSGGVDLVAVVSARVKGWETRAFPEKTCLHHRKMGSAQRKGVKAGMHCGKMDYLLGVHPLWQTIRAV